MRNYQITLFLDNDTIYRIGQLASKIEQEIEYLGEPILLPDNINFPSEANAPLIIFNKNIKIQITANFRTIVITLQEDELIKPINIMEKIFTVLQSYEIRCIRIGYATTFLMDNEKIKYFKEQFVLKEEVIKSLDIELSWLTRIIINNKEVNCWQRYFTNKDVNDKLNVIFDINTKAEEINMIDYEFSKTFIEEIDNYIQEKTLK